MKNLADEFRKSFDNYEILCLIGTKTWQIKLKNYNKIAVLKKIDNVSVYEKLKELKIKGIPLIYDIFEKDGESYVIEEFINGNNLSSEIVSRGYFSKNEVKNIVIKLSNILFEIHKANIIHRDIKPSNIILTRDNNIYLIDFGIARSKNDSTISDTRHLGTEFYASPEQYGFAQTDKRSDIYSIGKLMIVLLKGKETTKDLKNIPYYNIISKCTEIDSAKRYSDVYKLKSALLISDKIIYCIIASLLIILILLLIIIKAKNKEEIIKTTEITTEIISETNVETTTIMLQTEISQATTTEITTLKPNNDTTTLKKGTGTSTPQQSVTPSQKPANTENTTNNSSSQSSSTKNQTDYDENTLCTNYENDLGRIYYDGIDPFQNPYINIGEWSPKQVNNITFSQGKSAKVFAEQTTKGLNITINGQTIQCPNTGNVAHTPLENKVPNGRSHTAIFYDFTGDGIKDIFVVEMAYYLGNTADDSDVLYLSGFFIKVNSNLQMTLLGGDKLLCQSGYDQITICPDHILTENTIGTTFLSYKIENDKVIKYNGI
ncbi:MAG: serine/threonine-protein kinase [Lachnospirales bacterium]